MKARVDGRILLGEKGVQKVGDCEKEAVKFIVQDEKRNEILCYVTNKDLVKTLLEEKDILTEIALSLSGEIQYKPGQRNPVFVVESIWIPASDLTLIRGTKTGLPAYVEGIVAIEK
jgi:hypothetical protein